MINYQAIVRSISRDKCVDEDTAWSAVAEAYLRLDTTRPIPQQAAYLKIAGSFLVYSQNRTCEISIEGLDEFEAPNDTNIEEEFMKALGSGARAVVNDILDKDFKIVTVDSVRRTLRNNNLNYSRKYAKEIINELRRNFKRRTRT